MKQHAIEITSFKLLGSTLKEFINVNKKDIDEWLKNQEGFQSRHIIETSDGTIMDIVFWDKSEQGTEAMLRLMGETSNSKIHSMIDQRTVSWNIYEVKHTVDL
jgi:hypothetical protein